MSSTKTIYLSALVLTALAAGAASAQEQIIQYDPARLAPMPAAQPLPANGGTPVAGPAGSCGSCGQASGSCGNLCPSAYITYQQPDCCGPVGRQGDIYEELFVRSGASEAVDGIGGLNMGWMTEVGGRTLFFNAREEKAWVVDLSVGYTYNNGSGDHTYTLTDDGDVTIRTLHRTYFTFDLGREYYLIGSAHSHGRIWRIGLDGGVRWGTTRMDLNDPAAPDGFRRLNSWDWGPVVAVHSDIEIPHGCCTWVFGIRGEWDKFYNNRLPIGIDHTISDINVLLTIGARF